MKFALLVLILCATVSLGKQVQAQDSTSYGFTTDATTDDQSQPGQDADDDLFDFRPHPGPGGGHHPGPGPGGGHYPGPGPGGGHHPGPGPGGGHHPGPGPGGGHHPGPGPGGGHHPGPGHGGYHPGPGHGTWTPFPGWHRGWHHDRSWRPHWYRPGIRFPIFAWLDWDIPVGYWQCSAFDQNMQEYSELGRTLDEAAYGALYDCGGASYREYGCYIPDSYCQRY